MLDTCPVVYNRYGRVILFGK